MVTIVNMIKSDEDVYMICKISFCRLLYYVFTQILTLFQIIVDSLKYY